MIGGNAAEGLVVACNPVQRHEATSQEGVMNFHLCLSLPINSFGEALEMKARSPAEKFMDVSDVKVTDEDGFLSRSMMIKAKKHLQERIWINRVISEIMFSVSDTVLLHDERITTVREAGTTAAIYRRECHLGRALTVRFVMLSVRSLSRSTERCGARQIILVMCLVMCCPHVLTGMCMSAIRGTPHQT